MGMGGHSEIWVEILSGAGAFCWKFTWSAHQVGDWTPRPSCLQHFRLILLMSVRMCNFCSFVLGIYKRLLSERKRGHPGGVHCSAPKTNPIDGQAGRVRLKRQTNGYTTLVDGNKCRCFGAKPFGLGKICANKLLENKIQMERQSRPAKP